MDIFFQKDKDFFGKALKAILDHNSFRIIINKPASWFIETKRYGKDFRDPWESPLTRMEKIKRTFMIIFRPFWRIYFIAKVYDMIAHWSEEGENIIVEFKKQDT